MKTFEENNSGVQSFYVSIKQSPKIKKMVKKMAK